MYFTLATEDGRVFGNWSSLPLNGQIESVWYAKAVQTAPFPAWLPLQTSFLKGSKEEPPMISMVRALEGNMGVLRTSIKMTQITEWLAEVKNSSPTLIFNDQGELIYGQDQFLPASIKADLRQRYASWNSVDISQFSRSGYRVISQGLPLKGWTLVQLLDEDELYKDIHFLMKGFSFAAFVALLVFITITILITNRITRPLKRLKRAMKRVGDGQWNAVVAVETKDEIGQITYHFNAMVQQIGDLFGQLREEERKKTEIYYESLLAQVNPHFLFNTLSSIKWTATISKAHHVADLLTSLGKILEMSTSRVEDRIPLIREIEYVKHYMNLQYARFGERVKLSIDVPDELMQAMIPKFIIQPLVENAIIHGFEQHELRGEIAIEAYRSGENLLLFVKDNGKGIGLERQQLLFGSMEPEANKRISGIGIRNVQERLKIIYGPTYGMVFSSEEGSSTIVRILLPYMSGEEMRVHVQGADRR
jgi:two-component system sensor histidine kinase YesM